MKTIQVQFRTLAPRTMDALLHGFEGPAQKPLNGFIVDGGRVLNKGDLTGAYTVVVPPDGNFEVLDTPKNREQLRKITKPGFRWQNNSYYNNETGETIVKKEKIELPVYYFITDGTDLDDEGDRKVEEEETVEIVKPRGKGKFKVEEKED